MNYPGSRWWVLAAVLFGPSPPPTRELVVTIDDLPATSVLPLTQPDRDSITAHLVGALEGHRIPAIGFVNENKLYDSAGSLVPARVALLRRWLAAGLELGNHTWSHPNLDRIPLADFEADVLRGERVLRPLLRAHGDSLRFFRHPYLSTGSAIARRDSLVEFLATRGYQVAPVTIDNGDYLYAAAYDRSRAAGDSAIVWRLRADYLDYLERVVGYYEGQAQAIVGHSFPQILLLHASRLNADTFERLAQLLERRGYHFVSLSRALRDPTYGLPDQYAGGKGISWLHRWALTRGIPRRVLEGEPEVPDWVNQAANAAAGAGP
jgi:peptidoglycan/xylan/chitin deacetylase (PgdA/CDA1 family)